MRNLESGSTAAWRQEEVFRAFVESSDDLVTVVDPEGCFLYVNPAAERILGASEECLGRSAWDFIHQDDQERTRAAFRTWLEAKETESFVFENRQVCQGGEIRNVLWTITRQRTDDGEISCLVSSGRDITAIRRYEAELNRSEIRSRALLAGLLDPTLVIDGAGIVQEANASCAGVFGYAPEELIGQNIKLLMPEPYRSEHDFYLRRYAETGKTWILGKTREFEVVRKDGARIVVELSVSRIDVEGEGEPLFCGSFRDVTARKEAEEALAESERLFRAIFDREFEFVGLLTPEGITLEANRTVLEAAGLEREDVVGKPFWESVWWARSDEDAERMQAAVERAARGEFVRFEIERRDKDGRACVIDFSIKPLRDGKGQVALLIPEGRDITDLKRAQQRELAMMRAFAEIGESASLLAHEIKNPVTSVNLALRAVARQLGEDDREILEDLVERMQKLEKLMKRTLTLARPLDLHMIRCAPHDLLSATARTMKPQCEDSGVTIEVRSEHGLDELSIDPQLFEDVLTNLVRNGVEAMQAGGRIRMSARKDGRQLVLCVEDDGPGVPETVRATLFKPFVSTKASGTGLGLAIVRKIVDAHGGTIEALESSLGGAAFEIRLPGA